MTIEQPPPLSIVSDMKKNLQHLQIFVLTMLDIIAIMFFQTFEKS